MTYKETLDYMYAALPMFHRIGANAYKKDLTNITLFCEYLGNPQNQLKCIHIAGTNGKGSVSHLLSAILQTHGFKTGLYVSPHYKDFRERIKINGIHISKKYVCDFIEKHKEVIEKIQPSFFEMTVAMAFQYFKECKIDYAVIETGLGGRLDSTNIITPFLSIITNISYDHTDLLGDQLEKIAFEKAGIIKKEIPVIIGRSQDETENVFIEQAAKMNSAIFFADKKIHLEFEYDELGIKSVKGNFLNNVIRCKPQLNALYQEENIRTVWLACEFLTQKNILQLNSSAFQKAIEETATVSHMMGRWQLLQKQPYIIGESAHNEDGIEYLQKQITTIQFKKLHIVCGFVNDKPLEKVFEKLPKYAMYYFAKANIPRGMDAPVLKIQAKQYDLIGKSYSSVKNALKAAKRKAGKNDLILITGSIFVVAEVL